MKDKLDIWVRIGLIMLVIVLNLWWPDHEAEAPVDPPEERWEEGETDEAEDESDGTDADRQLMKSAP